MKKGAWAVLLSYVLWGVFPIYWKLLADVDSVYVLCCRIVFSLVVSLIVVPSCGKWGEAMRVLRDRRRGGICSPAGCSSALTGARSSTAWPRTGCWTRVWPTT